MSDCTLVCVRACVRTCIQGSSCQYCDERHVQRTCSGKNSISLVRALSTSIFDCVRECACACVCLNVCIWLYVCACASACACASVRVYNAHVRAHVTCTCSTPCTVRLYPCACTHLLPGLALGLGRACESANLCRHRLEVSHGVGSNTRLRTGERERVDEIRNLATESVRVRCVA